jgi:Fic-DOC domain mobile mystery protein B
MGLRIDYPDGATPLDPDDMEGLIPTHITNQGQLNEWEFVNVVKGEEWAFRRRRRDLLSPTFVQTLHRKMFGATWRWAGSIRTKEILPVGVAPENIRPELHKLLGDVQAQLDFASVPIREVAARFHHRMVWIHPFPNGNGRFSRTIADMLLWQNGQEQFKWGADLTRDGDARRAYISALQSADRKDYKPLFALLGISDKC